MSKKGKKRRGRAPRSQERIDMHALGYCTPAEVAKLLNVAPTTVYGWANAWREADLPPLVDGKNVVVETSRGIWILKAAARKHHVDPKTLARTNAA